MTACRLALRRSPLRWWFPVFVAVDVAFVFLWGDRSWIGVWPQASAAVQLPTFYLAPVVSAGAAWSASGPTRYGRAGLRETSSRAEWQVEAPELLATLAYPLLAYLVGAVAATAVTWPSAGPGMLWPGYVLLGVAVIVLCGCAGYVMGRLTESRLFACVASALISIVFMGTVGEQGALGFSVLGGDPQVTVTVGAALARLAVGAAVLAFALLAAPHLRRARRWKVGTANRMGQVIGLVAAPLALALPVIAGPVVSDRPAPARPLCTTTQPRMCVWPEQRKYLPALTAIAHHLAALPPGLFRIPDTFYERRVDASQDPDSGFLITGDDQWSVASTIVAPVLQASLPPYCDRAEQEQSVVLHAYQELASWLSARAYGAGQPSSIAGGPPDVDPAVIAALVRQPEQAQTSWARSRIATITTSPCA